MGKSAGSPPPAPDPTVTANAQADANAKTARLQATLNRVDQVTPYGSVTYSQGAAPMDRNKWINDQVAAERAKFSAQPAPMATYAGDGGADNAGNAAPEFSAPGVFDEAAARARFEAMPTPEVPGQDRWTQTTTLSPEQKELYDLTTQGQKIYGTTAVNLLDGVKGALSSPVDVDWQSVRDKALQGQRERMDPVFRAQEEDLRSRLLNAGLTPGSEGWNREYDAFTRARNDAYTTADLRAGDYVNQSIDATARLRAMPLNEASALLSGSQVQMPQAQPFAGVNVAPTDVTGAYNSQYQGQLAGWQADQQRQNSAMGGLFGLAGTIGGAAMKYGPGLFALSDARAKKDIVPIGKAHNGLPIYAFRYKGSDTPQIGLMAQDVERVNPGAVATTASGLKAVDYGRALLDG